MKRYNLNSKRYTHRSIDGYKTFGLEVYNQPGLMVWVDTPNLKQGSKFPIINHESIMDVIAITNSTVVCVSDGMYCQKTMKVGDVRLAVFVDGAVDGVNNIRGGLGFE